MSDRVLIVTGASRGIGRAVAVKAATEGYRVAVNYVSDQAAADAAVAGIAAAGGTAVAIRADVGDPDAIAFLFAETARLLGPLTHLVNNAGITGKSSRLDAASAETIRTCIDVNVTGAILVAQEAVRRMAPRHGGKGGAIVNISSAATTIGSAGEYVWYAASKGAIDSFTLGLARELATERIRVNAVAPGLTSTDIHVRSSQDGARVGRLTPMIPMQRPGESDEIADAVLYLLGDHATYITGAVLRVTGGR